MGAATAGLTAAPDATAVPLIALDVTPAAPRPCGPADAEGREPTLRDVLEALFEPAGAWRPHADVGGGTRQELR